MPFPPPPPLDTRSQDDLVRQLEAQAQSFTTNVPDPSDGTGKTFLVPWTPPADRTQDVGAALVRIFARMASRVIERLNRAPEQHHLAFLNLLGTEQLPAQPARAALTFLPSAGNLVEPVVPAQTPVAAPAAGPLPESVFYTENDLVLTRAQLNAVFVRAPAHDHYADNTAIAVGDLPGAYAAFDAGSPLDHSLYIACDALITLPGVQAITLTFGVPTYVVEKVLELPRGRGTSSPAATAFRSLQWQVFDGTDFVAVTPVVSDASPSTSPSTVQVAFQKGTLLPTPSTVNGQSASWIKASLASPPVLRLLPPAIHSCSASVTSVRTAVQPDAAFYNSSPLDLTKDFYPFGTRPQLFDTFYVASADVLAKPGIQVTVTMTMSNGITPDPSRNPSLIWEVWTGSSWKKLDATPTPPNAGNFLVTGTVALTLPQEVQPTTVNGILNSWLRVRILGGDYGHDVSVDSNGVTKATYAAPAFSSFTFAYSNPALSTLGSTAPPCTLMRLHDSSYQTWTNLDQSFVPFAPVPDTQPALYVGFDRAFSNESVSLYVQLDPPTPAEVAVVDDAPGAPPPAPGVFWEYFASADPWAAVGAADETLALDSQAATRWASLDAVDGTEVLNHSGVVAFIGPKDFQPSVQFGQKLYWLRARLSGSFPTLRRLSRLITNTAWATQAATIVDEILGSSNGAPSQIFQLSQAPVMLGEQIEVDEPEQQWTRWLAVPDFYASGADDRHYVLDRSTGQLTFGDGLHGMVPLAGNQNIRAATYQWGGGLAGNRPANAITQLKATIAYVDSAVNHEPATGGGDAETLDRLKDRAGRVLRHGGRAVAVQDFEDLAMAASPSVARARAIPPTFEPSSQDTQADPTQVRGMATVLVIIVPRSDDPTPVPGFQLIEDVRSYIAARCSPFVTLLVSGPDWSPVDVTLDVALKPEWNFRSDAVKAALHLALQSYLHPLLGGADGTGWEFGVQPHVSDLYAVVSNVAGVEHVNQLSIAIPAPFLGTDDGTLDDGSKITDADHGVPDVRKLSRSLIYARNLTVTASGAAQ